MLNVHRLLWPSLMLIMGILMIVLPDAVMLPGWLVTMVRILGRVLTVTGAVWTVGLILERVGRELIRFEERNRHQPGA